MRGGGLHDPSRNRNAYPMTGERPYPERRDGVGQRRSSAGRYELADDPADHRGILSWHSQKRDRFLREAGSYGELLRVAIPATALDDAARTGAVTVRLEVIGCAAGRTRDLWREVRPVSARSDGRVRAAGARSATR